MIDEQKIRGWLNNYYRAAASVSTIGDMHSMYTNLIKAIDSGELNPDPIKIKDLPKKKPRAAVCGPEYEEPNNGAGDD